MLIVYALGVAMSFMVAEAKTLTFVARVRVAKAGVGIGVADRLLDAIEPDLIKCAEDMGLPYIRPELSPEGKRLLLNSPAHFMKLYLHELQNAVNGSFNFVQM